MEMADPPTPPSGDVKDTVSSDQVVSASSKPPSSEPVVSPERIRLFTDRALRFLSTANNETLGACAVGLCATTYFILGRVGLVLIGVVGGVVLHAAWDDSSSSGDGVTTGSEKVAARKKDLALEISKRVLDWQDKRRSSDKEREEDIKVEGSVASKPLDYTDFRPATGSALTVLTDAIIRDYVKWWYGSILPSEESFPAASRQILTSFILSISNHVAHKRPAEIFLDFLSNSASIVLVFLHELSSALRVDPSLTPEAAIQQYLQSQPDSNLANVLSMAQQERKLGLVADDILATFLDSKAYNFAPSKTFLREILAGVVLESTIKSCSKPEWINEWIVYLLEDNDSDLVSAIDAGLENMNAADSKSPVQNADKGHARRVSKAEQAMEQAMLEAQKMNEMIAEEDANKRKESLGMSEAEDTESTVTTEGIATPTSFESENRSQERQDSSVKLPTPNESGTQSPEPQTNSQSQRANASIDFDQLVPIETGVLTLYNANVSILDDGDAKDKVTLRSKPIVEYLLQIEPSNSKFPGWMIVRKYQDFESLHPDLSRISRISDAAQFADSHQTLAPWKGQSKFHLRQDLEAYIRDALKYKSLAESKVMTKFLEKETGLGKAPAPNKNLFLQGPAALESMGKGFVNVLGSAPKGIAGGGKAVFDGVQGVFGAVGGPKKAVRVSTADKPLPVSRRESHDSRLSYEIGANQSSTEIHASPISSRQSTDSGYQAVNKPMSPSLENLDLPPPPDAMPSDYDGSGYGTTPIKQQQTPTPIASASLSTTPSDENISTTKASTKTDIKPEFKPLSEEETRVTIDLLFALITELYTLSSAWTIRLSLLSAAKTYLLRPANPQLESIRLLLQDSVIDANLSSDTGIAAHLLKLRENTLPTSEELASWPAEKTLAEKEALRVKARKLLVEKGMPAALTGVMGAAASGEALGRVFDCLQVERVGRGLIFALLLQALRAATQ